MTDEIAQKRIDILRRLYPPGTQLQVVSMKGDRGPAPGTKGIVLEISKNGNIHMRWETRDHEHLIPGLDRFMIIKDEDLDNPDDPVAHQKQRLAIMIWDAGRPLVSKETAHKIANRLIQKGVKVPTFTQRGEAHEEKRENLQCKSTTLTLSDD